jgi:hypothetical protein
MQDENRHVTASAADEIKRERLNIHAINFAFICKRWMLFVSRLFSEESGKFRSKYLIFHCNSEYLGCSLAMCSSVGHTRREWGNFLGFFTCTHTHFKQTVPLIMKRHKWKRRSWTVIFMATTINCSRARNSPWKNLNFLSLSLRWPTSSFQFCEPTSEPARRNGKICFHDVIIAVFSWEFSLLVPSPNWIIGERENSEFLFFFGCCKMDLELEDVWGMVNSSSSRSPLLWD